MPTKSLKRKSSQSKKSGKKIIKKIGRKGLKKESCLYRIASKPPILGVHIYLMSTQDAKSHDAFLKRMGHGHGHGHSTFPKSIWTDFRGRKGDSLLHHFPEKTVHLVGYGDEEGLQDACIQLGKHYAASNHDLVIHLATSKPIYLQHQIDGFIYGHYQFHMYKTTAEGHAHSVTFYHKSLKLKRDLENALAVAKVRCEIRNYINMPANELGIPAYIKLLRRGLPAGVKMRVMTEAQLRREGLNLVLAVNQGGRDKTAMVILEYGKKRGAGSRPICLVGKGVMYDTGGYDIKHTFTNCHFDMTGSAVAYGILKSLALLKSPQHVVALLPLVENDISEKAYKTGDIIRSYKGLTVEVGDTDAEGRLILADAMAYAEKYRPRICIDMGTLSGEAAHIFQDKSAVVMGRDHRLNQKIVTLGEIFHEHVWELPMWDVYLESTRDSKVADLRSTSQKPGAGTIFIGAFLSHFVPKDSNWIHMDIAGVDSDDGLSTGTILNTMTHFVQNHL